MKLDTTKMLADVEDGIGWITFNNPERRNAISLEMWEGLGTILESFQHDESVRVVVMKGAGEKAFVSGADISEFDSKRGNAEQKKLYAAVSANASLWLGKMDKPLIAMIQGFCIGGGLATALSADIRFATVDSTFGIPAAKLGLGYEYGGLKALSDLVGPSSAKDIMFSARFLDAEEALRIGLINFVVSRQELEQKVRDYAALIAENAPLTVKAAKAAVNEITKDSAKRDLETVNQMINACFDSEDYAEGRRAFREKRKPAFRGR
ncbi:MAG: enoyl-CoA hydratase [Gammaproteobacteria bacterium]|jgi:enoyl-CoA hydratase/carnithine racemase|nr:enoyl-CoA hydratase [Gammaproteobacteria bacterium]|tara:strand:- start:13513 stop:14307 length:795 start_codon:yes stop_codon:yes gene_type:complete